MYISHTKHFISSFHMSQKRQKKTNKTCNASQYEPTYTIPKITQNTNKTSYKIWCKKIERVYTKWHAFPAAHIRLIRKEKKLIIWAHWYDNTLLFPNFTFLLQSIKVHCFVVGYTFFLCVQRSTYFDPNNKTVYFDPKCNFIANSQFCLSHMKQIICIHFKIKHRKFTHNFIIYNLVQLLFQILEVNNEWRTTNLK